MEEILGSTIRFMRVANRLVKSEGARKERVGEFCRSAKKSAKLALFFNFRIGAKQAVLTSIFPFPYFFVPFPPVVMYQTYLPTAPTCMPPTP